MVVYNNKLIDIEEISCLNEYISRGLDSLITNREEAKNIQIKPISHIANNIECECSLCSAVRRVNKTETITIPLYEYEQMLQKIKTLSKDRATFSNNLNELYNSLINKPIDYGSKIYELIQVNQELKGDISKLQEDKTDMKLINSVLGYLKNIIVNLDRGNDNNIRIMEDGETGLAWLKSDKSDVFITKYDLQDNVLSGFSVKYKYTTEDFNINNVILYYPVDKTILDILLGSLK